MKKAVFGILVLLSGMSNLLGNTAGKVPLDFDGDGKTDLAVLDAPLDQNLRAQYSWHIMRSRDGYAVTQWGAKDNNATGFFDGRAPADYDGDGKSDIAVWRGRNVVDGMWYWQRSSDGQIAGIRLGLGSPLGHLPVPGDYDGDGKTDPAIAIRDSTQSPNCQFWILGSSAGLSVTPWGLCQLNPDQPLMVRTTTQ